MLATGAGQGPFAAQLLPPQPHSQQSAMVVVERSTGSIVDATSPFWSGKAGGSILSPGDVSIKTASSMWGGGEREAAGGWGEHEHEKNGEENEKWEDKDDETEGWEEAQEEDEEEEGDHSRRRFLLLDKTEKKHPSAEDDPRERGPATRYREKRNNTV